eukprot:6524584-Pyramimonas_sp.AAC.1
MDGSELNGTRAWHGKTAKHHDCKCRSYKEYRGESKCVMQLESELAQAKCYNVLGVNARWFPNTKYAILDCHKV